MASNRIPGLALFNLNDEEYARAAKMTQDNARSIARMRRELGYGDNDGDEMDEAAFRTRLNGIAQDFTRMGRAPFDRAALRTSLQSIGTACHSLADAVSRTEEPPVQPTDDQILKRGFRGGNR